MTKEKLYKQLYDKLNAEMNEYKCLLLKQPPEKILDHAFEYSMREFVLMCVVGGGLTETEVQSLMNSHSPFLKIGEYAKGIETHILDYFRDCMTQIGDEWKTNFTNSKDK